GGQDVEKSSRIKRKRVCDNVAFSTQDSINKRTTNTVTEKDDASVKDKKKRQLQNRRNIDLVEGRITSEAAMTTSEAATK
ncbi:hypothetical protein A2U01_0007549, partial [Trifolium medium]|nr:hypothetical protein [Trifolium medium]